MGEHRLRQVPPSQRTMHLSLIAVWLGTALVSAIEHRGLSVQVLADAGIHDARWQTFLIWSGLLADLAVGLALWLRPGPGARGPLRAPGGGGAAAPGGCGVARRRLGRGA